MTSGEERQKDDCLATGNTTLIQPFFMWGISTQVTNKEVENFQFLHTEVFMIYFIKTLSKSKQFKEKYFNNKDTYI